MSKEEPTNDAAAAARRIRHAQADAALRDLAALVKHYHKQNLDFEKALDERHARWAARGLLK